MLLLGYAMLSMIQRSEICPLLTTPANLDIALKLYSTSSLFMVFDD